MLYQGFSVSRKSESRRETPWEYHPFHQANNINGIDGDANGDGEGYEIHELIKRPGDGHSRDLRPQGR